MANGFWDYFWPYCSAVIAVLLFLGLSYLATTDPKTGRWAGPLGLINGADNKLSTSKFQFFLWTAVCIFAFVAVWVRLWMKDHTAVSLELAQNLMLAMGFTVVTAATAKGVTSSYVATGRVTKGAASSGRPSLRDLVTGDDGAPDMAKVQMLSWTFIAVVTYLLTIGGTLYGGVADHKLPDIPEQLMILMGIGQGAYLGLKIVQSNTAKIFNVTPSQGKAATIATINGQGFGTKKGSVIFGNVAASVADSDWTDTAVKFTVPANNANGTAFKAGDTVGVGILLQGTTPDEWAGTHTVPFTFSP